jgi:hypothetical protein
LEAAVDRFLERQNIERYRRLKDARSAAERRRILGSLAEERAKFKLEFRSVDHPRESRSSACRAG